MLFTLFCQVTIWYFVTFSLWQHIISWRFCFKYEYCLFYCYLWFQNMALCLDKLLEWHKLYKLCYKEFYNYCSGINQSFLSTIIKARISSTQMLCIIGIEDKRWKRPTLLSAGNPYLSLYFSHTSQLSVALGLIR